MRRSVAETSDIGIDSRTALMDSGVIFSGIFLDSREAAWGTREDVVCVAARACFDVGPKTSGVVSRAAGTGKGVCVAIDWD